MKSQPQSEFLSCRLRHMDTQTDRQNFVFLMLIFYSTFTNVSGADPGGPPLILGFEAPKLSIFGPYLIFP